MEIIRRPESQIAFPADFRSLKTLSNPSTSLTSLPCGVTPSPIDVPPPDAIGWDLQAHEWVLFPPSARATSTHLIGPPGHGKTTLLTTMKLSDIKAGLGVIALDAVGDWTRELLWRIVTECPSRVPDIVILDPRDRPSFRLPIYRQVPRSDRHRFQRAVDQSVAVYESLWGSTGSRGTSWGPVLQLLATAIGHTFVEAGAGLEDVGPFLSSADVRRRVLSRVTNPKVLQYWAEVYPAREREQQEYAASFLNKVLPFSLNETVANIVGGCEATVDLRQLLDAQKIVIVPLRVGEIGAEAAALIGSNIIGEIFTAVRSRSDTREDLRRPCRLYIDECQLFQHPDLPKLEAEARKFKLGIVKAHQHLEQLPEALQASARMATNLFIGRQSGTHAQVLAGDFDNPPEPGEPEYKPVMLPSGKRPGLNEQLRAWYGTGRDAESYTQYEERPGPLVEVSAMRDRRANRIVTLPFYQFMGRFRQGDEIAESTFRALPSPTFGRQMPRWVKATIAEIRVRSRNTYARASHAPAEPIMSSRSNGWSHERDASTARWEELPVHP